MSTQQNSVRYEAIPTTCDCLVNQGSLETIIQDGGGKQMKGVTIAAWVAKAYPKLKFSKVIERHMQSPKQFTYLVISQKTGEATFLDYSKRHVSQVVAAVLGKSGSWSTLRTPDGRKEVKGKPVMCSNGLVVLTK